MKLCDLGVQTFALLLNGIVLCYLIARAGLIYGGVWAGP
jgi:hypothetical protein